MSSLQRKLKECTGFINELCQGLKKRFPDQYAYIDCDEYGENSFTVNELFEFVIDPIRADLSAAEDAVAKACVWYSAVTNGQCCPICGGGNLESGEGHIECCPYPAFVEWDKRQTAKLKTQIEASQI